MRTKDLIATAISNTFRSKLRTTLTVLAIFVGAFTLTLTNAVGALGSPDVFIITQASEATEAGDDPFGATRLHRIPIWDTIRVQHQRHLGSHHS
ncbi:hypothetical protein [Cryobacterium sp. Y50]|uniref:hypothetical protein n=1 Tax=Cryobacterium sp. Y50 TaxID=2048286 RepID=UPI001304D214|nr:hypothetical protein [Cryobacterium sp. Y50]